MQMLEQSNMLVNKISVATEYNNLNLPTANLNFYSKYSRFTLKALRKTAFQKFLSEMLKSENIPQQNIDSVQIEIFPAPRKNGLTIAGKCNTTKGKIRIYPKPLKFCDAFRKQYGIYILVAYVGNRARASLIHELLHLKYSSDEDRVRKLTKKYYAELIRKEYANSSGALSAYNLIFARVI
jgi:hypothetical protein